MSVHEWRRQHIHFCVQDALIMLAFRLTPAQVCIPGCYYYTRVYHLSLAKDRSTRIICHAHKTSQQPQSDSLYHAEFAAMYVLLIHLHTNVFLLRVVAFSYTLCSRHSSLTTSLPYLTHTITTVVKPVV